jgi:hypothetical protein
MGYQVTTLDSIREGVRAIEDVLTGETLMPQEARTFLVKLTALHGPVQDEVRRAESKYNHVLLSFLGSTEAKNRAEIRAQCSPEYGEYRAAKDLSEQIKQLVITCRGYLRSIDEEARLAR